MVVSVQRVCPALHLTCTAYFLQLALPLKEPQLTALFAHSCVCWPLCCSFGGFGSDLCSGNYKESWRDRSEFVKLAGERARKLCPGLHCRRGLHEGDVCRLPGSDRLYLLV